MSAPGVEYSQDVSLVAELLVELSRPHFHATRRDCEVVAQLDPPDPFVALVRREIFAAADAHGGRTGRSVEPQLESAGEVGEEQRIVPGRRLQGQ